MKRQPQPYNLIKLTLLVIFANFTSLYAQGSADTLTLTYYSTREYVNLNNDWQRLFAPYNITDPADVDFSSAVSVSGDSLYKNYNDSLGSIWAFRYIKIDSSLINIPLAIGVYQSGSIILYLNEKDIVVFGRNKLGDITDWTTLTFDSAGVYRFVLSFKDPDYKSHLSAGVPVGFYMYISDPGYSYRMEMENSSFNTSFQMFFTAFILSFAILHLILFVYLPELKSNLYFFLFLVLYALNVYFDFQAFLGRDIAENLVSLRVHRAVIPFTSIFILKFLYSLLSNKQPRYFYFLAAILVIAGALAVYSPVSNLWILNLAITLSTVEVFRVLYTANKNKSDGAKIVTFGFLLLFMFSSYDLLNDLGVIGSIGRLSNAYMFGGVGLIICISIYLAKQFAFSNRRLAEEATQRILLESDNKRKTWELEEARKLQLSLLPQCGDELLGYNVCFSMRTATEVGGDYYDYMIANDDTLTVVIGDATGHGMKAGNMVVLIKSLFNTMGHTFYIPDFFNHCTRQIKKMNFGNLFMSMSMVKLRRSNVVVSTAGMPPVLLYKKESDRVEEIVIKGMPLGAHDQFPYQEKMFTLDSGDVLLLLSDGVIELFNASRQMHGINRIKEIIKSNYMLSPSGLVEKFFESAEKWRGKSPQNDDMTFVVIKRK